MYVLLRKVSETTSLRRSTTAWLVSRRAFCVHLDWVYPELSGTANIVGLRLSYLVVLEGSRKCFKDAIDASKDLDLKAGEADAETIHSKLEEYMAALTAWSAPADAASPAQAPPGDLAEATGGQAVADAAEAEGEIDGVALRLCYGKV